MSRMNEGQRAALQVTEAARESHDELSFVAHLFMGEFRPEKLHPLTLIRIAYGLPGTIEETR